MDPNRLCYNCFHETDEKLCPFCGFDREQSTQPSLALPMGTILGGRYISGKLLGGGGFGLTYLAFDLLLELTVAIKEYLPAGLATRSSDRYTLTLVALDQRNDFQRGADRFLEEARTLARLHDLDGVVSVQNYFRENNTAYFVMDYIDGVSLKDYARQKGRTLAFEEALTLLLPVLHTLSMVHKRGLLHRDLSPDNIFITKLGKPVLLDFGAARAANNGERSVSVILKHGFAPHEQYSTRGNQGPWTDVYSMGALLYTLLSGQVPDDSIHRLQKDNLQSLRALGVELPEAADKAIRTALALQPEDRYQSMDEFAEALLRAKEDIPPAPVQEQKTIIPAPPPPAEEPVQGPLADEPKEEAQEEAKTQPPKKAADIETSSDAAAPHKEPAKPKRRRPWIAGAAAAAILILLGFFLYNSFFTTPAYDASGAVSYLFPEAEVSFLYRQGTLVQLYPESQQLLMMESADSGSPYVLFRRVEGMNEKEYLHFLDQSLSSNEAYSKGMRKQYLVNGQTYQGQAFRYTDADGVKRIQLSLAREAEDGTLYVLSSVSGERESLDDLLYLAAGSLQGHVVDGEAYNVGMLYGDMETLHATFLFDSGMRSFNGTAILPTNNPHPMVEMLGQAMNVSPRAYLSEIADGSIEEQVLGGRPVYLLQTSLKDEGFLYGAVYSQDRNAVFGFSLKYGLPEDRALCLNILETILQTLREDPNAYQHILP